MHQPPPFPTPRDAADAERKRKLDAQRQAAVVAKTKANAEASLAKLRLSTLRNQIKSGIKEGKREFSLRPADEQVVPDLLRGLAKSGWSGRMDSGRLVITPATPATPATPILIDLLRAVLKR